MSEAAVAVQQGVSDTQGDVWRVEDLPLFLKKNGRRLANVRINGRWHNGMNVTAIKSDEKGVLITVISRSPDGTPKDVYYSREDFRPHIH